MRITHVTWGHYPQWKACGPVIYLHTLALAQREAGHDVTIVCASDRKLEDEPAYATTTEVVDGIPYVHICNRPVWMHDFWNPGREEHDPKCAEAVAAACAESRPEVVHIHNIVGLSFDVVTAARMSGARVINSLHNYFPLCSRDDLFFADAENCGGPLERSCSSCLGTMVGDDAYRSRHAAAIAALNACDMNLAVSERVAEIYRSHGVSEDKLTVDRIGSKTAENLWRRLGAERVARAAAGLEPPTDSPLKLVFFGAPTRRKGSMVFLQSLRALKHPERVSATFFCCVPPDQVDYFNGFLASADESVRASINFFTAGFHQEDLDVILANADVAVLTPRWEDNGPQTVFEALSGGLPVVATRLGGIPDVVEDGVNGLLLDGDDVGALAAAIDRLSGDRELVSQLRAGILPPRSIADHARRLEGIYAPDRIEAPARPVAVSTADDVVAALAEAVANPAELVLVDAGADVEAARLLASVTGRVRVERDRDARPGAQDLPSEGWPAGEIPDLHTYLRWDSYTQLVDPTLKTLEVGCNAGVLTAMLAERIADLSACDIDLDRLEEAKQRMAALGRQDIVRFGNVCELPYPDASFEQVILGDILEYVTDDELAVRELARVLSPGGRLVVGGPLPGYDVLFPREWIQSIGHVRDGYTRDDLEQLLEPLFELVDWSENSRAGGVLGVHYMFQASRSIGADLVRARQLEHDPASEPYGFALLARRTEAAR